MYKYKYKYILNYKYKYAYTFTNTYTNTYTYTCYVIMHWMFISQCEAKYTHTTTIYNRIVFFLCLRLTVGIRMYIPMSYTPFPEILPPLTSGFPIDNNI